MLTEFYFSRKSFWISKTFVFIIFPFIILFGFSGIALAGTTERISVDEFGAEADNDSEKPNITPDGRYVAFTSAAANLTPGDLNGKRDVFVYDRDSGRIFLVSMSSLGAQADGNSEMPVMSSDGRYVAFYSLATNLVPGDTNGRKDIFVHDRNTGQTERVSVDSLGAQANGGSMRPAISSDGRYVVFESAASNLVAGDTNGMSDVFVHDRNTGQTVRVSVSSAGNQGSGFSTKPAISGDGRYVAFLSGAANLVVGDSNGRYDVFLHDRNSGQTIRVSVDSAGAQGDFNSDNPEISSDGRYIIFSSMATNLVPGDVNNSNDIFVHDRDTGQTTMVSVNSAGEQVNFGASYPAISPDGMWVSFNSVSTNLAPGVNNGWSQMFLHNRNTGQTSCVSLSPNETQGDSQSSWSDLSLNGRYVAFDSYSTNLVPGDGNNMCDIFVHDVLGGPAPGPGPGPGDGIDLGGEGSGNGGCFISTALP